MHLKFEWYEILCVSLSAYRSLKSPEGLRPRGCKKKPMFFGAPPSLKLVILPVWLKGLGEICPDLWLVDVVVVFLTFLPGVFHCTVFSSAK